MAKERELKEAVREGRDRVSRAVTLDKQFYFDLFVWLVKGESTVSLNSDLVCT